MSFVQQHLTEARQIIDELDRDAIERMADVLARTRSRGGRLFFLGVGGSAGNCSHAVNDFRKLAGFEAYAPTATQADACVIVPTVNPESVTPHAEAFQAVVWHLLVSHPKLKAAATKWESVR